MIFEESEDNKNQLRDEMKKNLKEFGWAGAYVQEGLIRPSGWLAAKSLPVRTGTRALANAVCSGNG